MAKKETAASGKALITFTEVYHGFDFGTECQHYRAGDTIEVDAEKAIELAREYGAGCPFKIGAENKALGRAPETK